MLPADNPFARAQRPAVRAAAVRPDPGRALPACRRGRHGRAARGVGGDRRRRADAATFENTVGGAGALRARCSPAWPRCCSTWRRPTPGQPSGPSRTRWHPGSPRTATRSCSTRGCSPGSTTCSGRARGARPGPRDVPPARALPHSTSSGPGAALDADAQERLRESTPSSRRCRPRSTPLLADGANAAPCTSTTAPNSTGCRRSRSPRPRGRPARGHEAGWLLTLVLPTAQPALAVADRPVAAASGCTRPPSRAARAATTTTRATS